MASRQQAPPAAPERPARDGDVEPVYEWVDDGDSYLLRLELPGFKKEELRVHVDTNGLLTVVGQQRAPGAGAGAGQRLHKVFQLPNTANLEAITGRFDGTVLTLTVRKLPQPGAVAPPTPPPSAKVTEAKPGDQKETERRTDAERAASTVRGEEEAERKAGSTAAPPSDKAEATHRGDEDDGARAEAEHRAKVLREAAAARRIEAARARVAEAKAAAERERRMLERAATEQGPFQWVEAIGKKEAIAAAAVAAFTLGVFVSRRLFSRS